MDANSDSGSGGIGKSEISEENSDDVSTSKTEQGSGQIVLRRN
jgi:hypothetical protein